MLDLTAIPHVEVLAMIGCIGVASIAAWSSAAVNMRLRMMERDFDDLYDELQSVREASAYFVNQPAPPVASPQNTPVPAMAARPARQSRRAPALVRPTQPATLPPLAQQYAPVQSHQIHVAAPEADRSGGQRPNVAQLAEQLSVQTREQMDNVLTPALDLGGSFSTIGSGRQESRLLRWMNGVTGQFSTIRQ